MNRTVFLSFALSRSEYVATYFRDEILPAALGGGLEFFHSRDIANGLVGDAVIVQKCKAAVAGISFLTKENINRPWINFEAGMMLGSLAGKLCLVCIGFEDYDFPKSPLLRLQNTKLHDREGIIKMLEEIYRSVSPADRRFLERIRRTVDENWQRWTEDLSRTPSSAPSPLDYEALGRQAEDFGIRKVYADSSAYVKEYPIAALVQNLPENAAIYMFGRNLLYSSGRFDETYKRAMRKHMSLNFICHDPATFSLFIQSVSELNPNESLTPVDKFRAFLDWIEDERPPGRMILKYYTGDMLDSVFCIKEDETVTHLGWELSFGKSRETDKRVLVLDPSKTLGKDIVDRYLHKIFEFGATMALYNGREFEARRL